MKPRTPADLSDDGLAAALLIAQARRLIDGRLGARTTLAELEAEQDRRIEVAELEALWVAS